MLTLVFDLDGTLVGASNTVSPRVLRAVQQAREHGCGLVQLTSDKRRHGAIRFYESLGFTASHEGLKLPL